MANTDHYKSQLKLHTKVKNLPPVEFLPEGGEEGSAFEANHVELVICFFYDHFPAVIHFYWASPIDTEQGGSLRIIY